MRRRLRTVLAALAVLALLASGCSRGSESKSAAGARDVGGSNTGDRRPPPKDPAPPKWGTKLRQNLVIGLVISSAGPGKDFQTLANGTQVVPFLVGDKVGVRVEDDNGDPAGAVQAVNNLIADGAGVIVYGSVGDQVDAGIKAAAAQGVPVIVVYDGNPALLANNPNAFSIALQDPQVAEKLVKFATKERNYTRFALMWDQDTTYGQAGHNYMLQALATEGLAPVADVPFGVADADLRAKVKSTGDAAAQTVFVWADATQGFRVIQSWFVAGLGSQMMVAPRMAVPALGTQDINQLTPPVRNGTLSTGIAGGPWDPTPAVKEFYKVRKKSGGQASADLSVADLISCDAGLLAVAAAEKGGSDPGDVMDALDGLTLRGMAAEYSFKDRLGVTPSDYAIVAYNREPDAADTYVGQQFPDVKSQGGFFVAVPGTAPNLKGKDPFE